MARQDQANDQFSLTSFLYGGNADYIDALYAAYEDDPASVNPEWQDFFAALKDDAGDVRKNAKGASWAKPSWPLQANGELVSALDGNWGIVEKHLEKKVKDKAVTNGIVLSDADVHQATRDSVRAIMMIRAYRMRGHLHANLDPLGIAKPLEDYNELSPENYGFTEADYDRPIFLDNVLGLEFGTIRQMLDILTRTYCSTLGVEFMHISDPEEKAWIQARIEGADKEITFTATGKKAILQKLVEAEGFEQFIDVKYKGTKRFGLDGSEALIPALEQIVKRGGQLGMKEIVLGMAHRGRLNVLSQVMAKPHRAIFHEFKGGSAAPDEVEGSGDVKYHLGASSDREFDGNKVHLSLTANPSHLEIVDPVVMGKARAKQDYLFGRSREEIVPLEERAKVLPLLLHGDAAFAGQGVIAEILGLSGLRGHRVAGTLHFIINNQIGFTTNPRFSRSSPYPSDVAKMIEAPIFHVNGDDPEAVVHATKVAIEFRMKFHKPVVVDMFCYRRFGHNEGDEPAFTQPIMYRNIRTHKTTVQIYADRLIAEGHITQAEFDKMKADWRAHLESRVGSRPALQAQQGRLAGRRLVGPAHGRQPGRTAARQDRRAGQDAEGNRQEADRGAEGFRGAQDDHPLPREPPPGDRVRRRHRLVDGRGAGLRRHPARRQSDPPVRPGFRTRHLLAAPFGALRPARRDPLHPAQQSVGRHRPATKSSTRCCRKRRCSASNMATAWPSRRR